MARTTELQDEVDYLQGCIDEAREALDAVNDVTSTRAELAQAVVAALDALNPDEEEADESAGEDSDADGDDD